MDGKLRRARLQKKLTREELARKAGVPEVTVAELERESGGTTTVEVLRKVASALGKTVEEIFLDRKFSRIDNERGE